MWPGWEGRDRDHKAGDEVGWHWGGKEGGFRYGKAEARREAGWDVGHRDWAGPWEGLVEGELTPISISRQCGTVVKGVGAPDCCKSCLCHLLPV